MTFSRLMTAFVIATSVGGSASMLASPAHAQNAIEAEIVGFHQLCEKGDRKACVRFGILIGRNEQPTPTGALRVVLVRNIKISPCEKAALGAPFLLWLFLQADVHFCKCMGVRIFAGRSGSNAGGPLHLRHAPDRLLQA